MPAGPRAIPLRMQRTTMNRTDIRPMPIPSLQVSSDRPYSAPNYLTQRTRSESHGGLSHPRRPATSLELYDIDELAPQHPVVLSRRRPTEEIEDEFLSSHPTASKDAEPQAKPPGATRRIAMRGSRMPSQLDSNSREDDSQDASSTYVPSDPKSSGSAVGQKRVTTSTAVESQPLKRIKINVIRRESRTPTAAATIRRTSSSAYPYSQLSQVSNGIYGNNATYETYDENVERLADDEIATQGSDNEDELAKALPTSKKSRHFDVVKPNPYDTINESGPIKHPQNCRTLDETRWFTNTKRAHVSRDIPRSSSATLQELDINRQSHTLARRQYTNASAQCDMPPEAAPVAIQAELEGGTPEPHLHPISLVKSTASSQEEKKSGFDNEDIDTQVPKIEEVVRAQEEKGMAQFIEERLSTGDSDTLETLTNELILGFAVHDEKLLENMNQLV